MAYTKNQVETAIVKFLPNGQIMLDNHVNLVTLLCSAVQYAFANKVQEDEHTEVLREAWLDLHTKTGEWNWNK